MTKEEILQSFLLDDIFNEQGYLTAEEARKYRWSNTSNINLIEVLKMAIEGDISNESNTITEKKINQLLNKQP